MDWRRDDDRRQRHGRLLSPFPLSPGCDTRTVSSKRQVTESVGFPRKEASPERLYGEVATKAAIDLGGPFVELEAREWPPDEDRVTAVEAFLAQRIPAALGPRLYTRTCLYDMPPDRDFLLDRLPGEERVLVCVGAGHAAKFAGVLGRILAELAQRGETAYPIEAFRADRPAITDPNFPRQFRLTVPVATT